MCCFNHHVVLVNPGCLTLDFNPSSAHSSVCEEVGHAVGVVTIKVTATPKKSKAYKGGASGRWLSLQVGKKKHHQQLTLQDGVYRGTFSFPKCDLQHDVVCSSLCGHMTVR